MPVTPTYIFGCKSARYARRPYGGVRRRLPWGAFFAGLAMAVVLRHGVAIAAFAVPEQPVADSPEARIARSGSVLQRKAAPRPAPAKSVAPQRTAVSGARRAAIVASRRMRSARRRWDHSVHAIPKRGQFKTSYRMKVTAYTPINTRMEGGRWTYTERDGRSAHGVAVDPRLIPLGTHLWIPGYGHAIADDIGGRIKGHRVDLRMQDARKMRRWGVRPVRVYVLSTPRNS